MQNADDEAFSFEKKKPIITPQTSQNLHLNYYLSKKCCTGPLRLNGATIKDQNADDEALSFERKKPIITPQTSQNLHLNYYLSVDNNSDSR